MDSAAGRKPRNQGGLLLLCLLAVLVAMAGNFFLWQQRNQQHMTALSRIHEIQSGTRALADLVESSKQGSRTALAEIDALQQAIAAAVGGPWPSPAPVPGRLTRLESLAQGISSHSGRLLENGDVLMEMAAARASLNLAMPRLQAVSEQLTQSLIDAGATAEQTYLGTRQLVLLKDLERHLAASRISGNDPIRATEALGRDALLFRRVLLGFRDGDDALGLRPSTDEAIRRALADALDDLESSRPGLEIALTQASELQAVQQATDALLAATAELAERTSDLALEQSQAHADVLWPSLRLGIGMAAIALLLLLMMGVGAGRRKRHAARAGRLMQQRHAAAIRQLLNELGHPTVTDLNDPASSPDHLAGISADALTHALQALQHRIATIAETARQMAAQAQETRATTLQLAEASEHQAGEIRRASEGVHGLVQSFDGLAQDSDAVMDAASSGPAMAHRGTDGVQQTLAGMNGIRQQIQQTSKRIKHLGESSQEIGDVVEFMQDLSEQANVLALNAAIQVAAAGAAGQGFGMIADEVQHLAQRASEIARRMETLVLGIQTDTAAALESIEQTTTQVVSVAGLVEDAGGAPATINEAANGLVKQVQRLSQAARDESRKATRIAQLMANLRELSDQTSTGTRQTAASVASLVALVGQLRDSLPPFERPDKEAR